MILPPFQGWSRMGRRPRLKPGLSFRGPSSFVPSSLRYGAALASRARRSSKSGGGIVTKADRSGRSPITTYCSLLTSYFLLLAAQISPIRIHAANRAGSFSARSGTSSLHFSMANGQRG
jgi:hypothetical protein